MPMRSRARKSRRLARSQSAKANMPIDRLAAVSTPQAAQASSSASVSEWPRNRTPRAASSALSSAAL